MTVRLSISSTLSRPLQDWGHTFFIPKPCTVHALYYERTGTIAIDVVECDGANVPIAEIPASELEKFYDELKEVVVAREF
jgi:hypothetical protein